MTMNETNSESGSIQSNGYDQYDDADINAARLVFSITSSALIPSHIGLNLLVIIIIYVFKSMQTIQNMLMASSSLNGFLAGLIFSPIYVMFYLPEEFIRFDKSNKYVCISIFVPSLFVGMGGLLNIAMISTDRFFAIVYPIKYLQFMTVRRARRIIIGVWVFCTVFAFLPYVWNDYEPEQCEGFTTISKQYQSFLARPLFGACLCISTIFNGVVFFIIFKSKRRCKAQTSKSNTFAILLQLSYLIFWVPYLISVSVFEPDSKTKTIVIFHTVATLFTNVYFTCLPLVYILVRKQARVAIRYILTTAPWKWSEQNWLELNRGDLLWRTRTPSFNPSGLSDTKSRRGNAGIGSQQPKERSASVMSDMIGVFFGSVQSDQTREGYSSPVESESDLAEPDNIPHQESTVDNSVVVRNTASGQSINSKVDNRKSSNISLKK